MTGEQMTEVLEVDGTEYTLRRRLGWMEQQKVDVAAFRFFVSGSALDQLDGSEDLTEMEEVEIRMNTPEQNRLRLTARLVGLRRRDIVQLPAAHVEVLVNRIVALEREEKAEVALLAESVMRDGVEAPNPTASDFET